MRGTTIDIDAVDAAHRAVRADPAIQFDFPWQVAETRQSPEWLRIFAQAIDAFFRALGPVWQVVFWLMVAAIVAFVLVALVPPLRDWLRARFGPAAADIPPEWRPEGQASRALLAEAETFAAAGRFDVAVQLLLYRSIEDIAAWRGGIVHTASTARDIAGAASIPADARATFGRLVALTERGIFARRPLDAADWQAAREAYRAFAL